MSPGGCAAEDGRQDLRRRAERGSGRNGRKRNGAKGGLGNSTGLPREPKAFTAASSIHPAGKADHTVGVPALSQFTGLKCVRLSSFPKGKTHSLAAPSLR